MWTVEEMVGVGMNRDAVEDFLRCACAKSFKCLYLGLKSRRGHLGGSWVVGRVERVHAYKGFTAGLSQQRDRLNKAGQSFLLRHR